MLGPATAKYLPEIVERLGGGVEIAVPPASPELAMAQYLGNALQIGLLAVAFALGQDPDPAPESSSEVRIISSDTRIEEAISARFAGSKIAENDFQVRVRDGVAVLTGRTDVVQHKGTATRLAKSAGAKRVDNRIEVTQRARDTEEEEVVIQVPPRPERKRGGPVRRRLGSRTTAAPAPEPEVEESAEALSTTGRP